MVRRKTTYIYDRPGWPEFRWDAASLAAPLGAVRHRQGRLLGRMEALGFDLRRETTLQTLTEDALETSESSLARRLGVSTVGVRRVDQRADAIATVVLDATQRFDQPLTVQRLFDWHAALFPLGASAATRSSWARGGMTRWVPCSAAGGARAGRDATLRGLV